MVWRESGTDCHWVPLSAAERHGVALIATGCHGVTVLVMMRVRRRYFVENVERLHKKQPLKGLVSDELMAPALA